MSAIQLPLILNNATTGHKLQGSSKDAVCIAKFACSMPDRPCVVLSRARTRRGLFPREPLDPPENFGSDPKLDAMTSRFRRLKALAQSEHVDEQQLTFLNKTNGKLTAVLCLKHGDHCPTWLDCCILHTTSGRQNNRNSQCRCPGTHRRFLCSSKTCHQPITTNKSSPACHRRHPHFTRIVTLLDAGSVR
jgi:hypothetical protein